ncbi:FecR domain-containing protein [Comamonas sp. GB3 AK4-5]|uniref:FecR domain-containing protein n=1 Tax=Comamonas sp. GB3 AK4-5 TaxID=3231487 RepID=UPI00351EDCD6
MNRTGPVAEMPPVLTRAVALQAAEWFVRLQAGDAPAADHQACAAWRARAPEHELAWQRALAVSQRAAGVPPALGSASLRRPQRLARRDAARALAVLMVAAPAGWLAWRVEPWQRWSASHATATGEWRGWTLADGSRMTLDTASAVDIEFDSYQRTIHLRSGAVWLETAPDPQPVHRPLLVLTPQGRVRAIGTRFSVRTEGERSQVAVQQGAVELCPRHSATVLRLQAGEQAAFDRDQVEAAQPAASGAGQWVHGVLAVDDVRLDDFVAELGRYRHGLLRCDPAVAGLRLTGAFQLADTEVVLHNLMQLLPVRLLYRTRYWVTLLPAA